MGTEGDWLGRWRPSQPPKPQPVSLEPVAARGELEGIVELVADEADAAVPSVEQVLRLQAARQPVVAEHAAEPGAVFTGVDEDDRDVGALEPGRASSGGGRETTSKPSVR